MKPNIKKLIKIKKEICLNKIELLAIEGDLFKKKRQLKEKFGVNSIEEAKKLLKIYEDSGEI